MDSVSLEIAPSVVLGQTNPSERGRAGGDGGGEVCALCVILPTGPGVEPGFSDVKLTRGSVSSLLTSDDDVWATK